MSFSAHEGGLVVTLGGVLRKGLLVYSVLVASGCATYPDSRGADATPVYEKVLIVPVETPPMLLEPKDDADRSAIRAAGLELPVKQGRVMIFFPFYWPIQALGGSIALETITVLSTSVPREGEFSYSDAETQRNATSAVLARKAGELLKQGTGNAVTVADGYIQLPILDRSVNLREGIGEMENWAAPLRRWYNSTSTSIDYSKLPEPFPNLIIEIGVFPYSYLQTYLSMVVKVKLFEPRGKHLIGKASCGLMPVDSGPLATMLADQGKLLRDQVEAAGEKRLRQCLDELGLLSRRTN